MYMNGCVGTHLESTSAMTFGSHSNNDSAGVAGAMVSLTTSLFGILNAGKAASCSVSSGACSVSPGICSSSGSSFTCSLTRLLLHRQSLWEQYTSTAGSKPGITVYIERDMTEVSLRAVVARKEKSLREWASEKSDRRRTL